MSPTINTVNPYLIACVASMAAFMELLDTTIVNVALSHIGGNLSSSQNESTWILTSYLVSNGISMPLSGWFAEVLGRKRFFLLCIAGFTVASLACGASTSLPMLIFFRLLQGLAGGGLQPMQMSIVMDAFPPEKRGIAFAITGMSMLAAPILGPSLGGIITDSLNWRWIFFINIPVGVLSFFLVKRLVEETAYTKAKGITSIDYIGLGLVILGLGTLQIVLDKGQEEDWFGSEFIAVLSIISSVSLIAAIVWLQRQKEPIIDIRLIANRSFGMACLMVFFLGFELYGANVLLPLLLESQYGYNATLAGLVLSPGAIALVFLMPIAGKLVNIVQLRYLIAFGMLAMSIGMWLTTLITPQTDYHTFVMVRITQVIGLPFLFVPGSTMAFSRISPEKSSKASALYSLLRNLGGSIGISIVASLVSRHEQIHQSILAEQLSPMNSAYQAILSHYTATVISSGESKAVASIAAMSKLYHELLSQSAILAYCDAFRMLAGITLTLAFIALLMPTNQISRMAPKDIATH